MSDYDHYNTEQLRSLCRQKDERITAEREAREKVESQMIRLHEIIDAYEQKLREAQEQEPVGYLLDGNYYQVKQRDDCGFGDYYPNQVPLYAAPPADAIRQLLSKDKEIAQLQAEVTRLSGKTFPECERLERKLAEQQDCNKFDATRLRRLVAFCGCAAPESDEELLQVAGVVLGSCLRALQNPTASQLSNAKQQGIEEAKLQAVPEWFSVKDKLPDTKYELDGSEVSQSVLLLGKCVAGYDGHGIGHYTSDGKWVCYEGEYDNQNIVEVAYWMPLYRLPESLATPEERKELGCQCQACLITPHASDCAVHNMPAYPNGQCNCGALQFSTPEERKD